MFASANNVSLLECLCSGELSCMMLRLRSYILNFTHHPLFITPLVQAYFTLSYHVIVSSFIFALLCTTGIVIWMTHISVHEENMVKEAGEEKRAEKETKNMVRHPLYNAVQFFPVRRISCMFL